MLTTTVTAGQMTLIKRTDVASTHLILFARGKQSGRGFTIPHGKNVHHYIEENCQLEVNIGTFSLAIRGKLHPTDIYAAQQHATDYTLTQAAGHSRRNTRRDPYASLQQYVEQSDKAPGALAPLHASGLGQGVPCDIMHLRPRAVSSWSVTSLPRFSQLINDALLTQYAHIHCLFGRAPRLGAPEAIQAPHTR